MPIVAPNIDQIVAVAPADLFVEQAQQRLTQHSAFESSRVELSNIEFGSLTYRLKRTLIGTFLRAKEQFLVDELSPEIVGNGHSASEAYEDFCLQFHSRIQDLMYMRPFEMSVREVSRWERIKALVDITVFKNRTPMVVVQYGIVKHGKRSHPSKIQWDNGYLESIDLRQVMKPDFVNYRPGQPVKAVVRRNPITREIIDIPFIEKVSSLPSPKELCVGGFVEQVLNAEPFPEADWD